MISKDLDLAVKILEDDGVIGFPTETVYGLAGNIFSEKAINNIFNIKKRPLFNPLIVHLKSIEELGNVASEIPEIALKLATAFWPGPLTLLLPKKDCIPDLITAGKPTVAVRIPNHPMALSLLRRLEFPLAAPSANPFKRISPTKAQHVENYFGSDIEMVLDGGICKTGVESTIVGFDNSEVIIYRLGGISVEEIKKITKKVTIFNKNNDSPEAPGMLLKHYAPKTPLIFTKNIAEEISKNKNKKAGILLFGQANLKLPDNFQQIILSESENLEEATFRFYESLHFMDEMNLEVIISQPFPDTGLGRVLNDKLSRASFD